LLTTVLQPFMETGTKTICYRRYDNNSPTDLVLQFYVKRGLKIREKYLIVKAETPTKPKSWIV